MVFDDAYQSVTLWFPVRIIIIKKVLRPLLLTNIPDLAEWDSQFCTQLAVLWLFLRPEENVSLKTKITNISVPFFFGICIHWFMGVT